MKISELISQLQQIQGKIGDREVIATNADGIVQIWKIQEVGIEAGMMGDPDSQEEALLILELTE